jgi:hypothetical protein
LNPAEQQEAIDKVIAKFPKVFRLRAFEGVFRIGENDSYFGGPGNTIMMLYTQKYDPKADSWNAFAKGTESELRREVVEATEEQKREHIPGYAPFSGVTAITPGKERRAKAKTKKFVLTIELGNDGMLDGVDIARALGPVADIVQHYDEGGLKGGLSHEIKDANGNTVGKWKVTK